jgi:hypothetical protein
MLRISLILLLVFSSTAVAREVKLSSAHGGSCPDAAADAAAAKPGTRKPPVVRESTVRESKPRPSVHSDVPSARPTRWHSFLPGMFR